MNKSFKKIMSLLISALLISTALGAGQLAAGSDKIAIDSENFLTLFSGGAFHRRF